MRKLQVFSALVSTLILTISIPAHATEPQSISSSSEPVEVRQLEVSPILVEDSWVQSINGTDVTQEVPPTNVYIINKDPQKCLPTPCETMTIKRDGDFVVVFEGGTQMTTSIPIMASESGISILVDGKPEPVILPSEIQRIAEAQPEVIGPLPSEILKLELVEGQGKSTYEVDLEKQTKFLGVVPILATLNYEFDALQGNLLSKAKPWFLNLFPLLFTT